MIFHSFIILDGLDGLPINRMNVQHDVFGSVVFGLVLVEISFAEELESN